jgi:hypothetical protein
MKAAAGPAGPKIFRERMRHDIDNLSFRETGYAVWVANSVIPFAMMRPLWEGVS